MSAVRRTLPAAGLLALALVITTGSRPPLAAQPEPKAEPKADAKAGPTADEVKGLRAKFQAEREEAAKAKFPADALARADDLAKRAEAALAANDPKAAAR